MKKILFVFKYPVCVMENLKRKFDGQMNACIQLGYQVWFIEWNGKEFNLICKNTQQEKTLCRCMTLNKNQYYHSRYFIDLYKACYIALKIQKYDYIYMRYMPLFPPAMKFINKINKDTTKFIIEMPTYPPENERKNEKRKIRKFALAVSDYYSKKVFSRVDLFSLCGESSNGRAYGKPAINIANGVDVKTMPVRHPKLKNNEINVLLLASMCYWQGYDRVIKGLRDYKGEDIIRIHFVGNDGDGSLEKWKKMSERYNVNDKIEFHGPLYEHDLDEIFDLSDIGIASMGLYRRENLQKGAGLKVREYMGRGLPFVYTGNDISINETLPYVLKVENNSNPLNLEQLIEFAKQFRDMEDVPKEMRTYAAENMSWTREFDKIFSAIKANGE